MRKLLLACLLFISFSIPALAQDSTITEKKFDHYFGIQVNELLKQLVSLSDEPADVNNPYLFTYALIANDCNYGFQFGFGFRYSESTDELSPAGETDANNAYYLRAGIVRRFTLGKKWEATAGFDFVSSYDKVTSGSTTVTDNGFSIDSTISSSGRITESLGAGLQLGLSFKVSRQIHLGTETTMYFTNADVKENSTVTNFIMFPSQPTSNSSSLSSDNIHSTDKSLKITLPVALFLRIYF